MTQRVVLLLPGGEKQTEMARFRSRNGGYDAHILMRDHWEVRPLLPRVNGDPVNVYRVGQQLRTERRVAT